MYEYLKWQRYFQQLLYANFAWMHITSSLAGMFAEIFKAKEVHLAFVLLLPVKFSPDVQPFCVGRRLTVSTTLICIVLETGWTWDGHSAC